MFAEKNFEDGNFTKDGYDYYLHLREQLLADLPLPHAMVYLDTTPQVCFDRIHNMRQRDCEDGIPLDYLAGLDACYLRLVERMRAASCPTIVVDWNEFGQAEYVEMMSHDADHRAEQHGVRLRRSTATLTFVIC